MMDTKEKSRGDIFSLEGIPPLGKAIPLSLQHVLAAVVGIVTPAIMVARVCNLSKPEEVLLIQSALFMSAICTFLQCLPIFGPIGSRLPVIFGTSFAYVPTLLALGGEFGIASIFGAQACGAVVAVIFGLFTKRLRSLFPPIVAGTVVFSIGLSLYPTAVGYMAGGKGSADFGSAKNWMVALLTLAVVLGITFFCQRHTEIIRNSMRHFGRLWAWLCARHGQFRRLFRGSHAFIAAHFAVRDAV